MAEIKEYRTNLPINSIAEDISCVGKDLSEGHPKWAADRLRDLASLFNRLADSYDKQEEGTRNYW